MGSHSITCHPTEVRIPPLPPAEAGTRFSDPGGMQGWVDLCYVKADRLGIEPATCKSQVHNALPLSHHDVLRYRWPNRLTRRDRSGCGPSHDGCQAGVYWWQGAVRTEGTPCSVGRGVVASGHCSTRLLPHVAQRCRRTRHRHTVIRSAPGVFTRRLITLAKAYCNGLTSVCLSVPSTYSPWLARGQHATRPAYILARQ